MHRFLTSACAALLVVSTAGAVVTPTFAASAVGGAQLVETAFHSHRGPTFYERGGYGYYNGQRGDRHFHRGWRQYNGYWFPPGAFIGAAVGAAILGGVIAHSR